jgi:hypothetical protein
VKALLVPALCASWALACGPTQAQVDALNDWADVMKGIGIDTGTLGPPRPGPREAERRQRAQDLKLLLDGARQTLFGLDKLLVIEMEAKDPDQMRWVPAARKVMVSNLIDYCRRGRGAVQSWLGEAADPRARVLFQEAGQALDGLERELRERRQDWEARGGGPSR